MQKVAAVALVLVTLQACEGCQERSHLAELDGGTRSFIQEPGGMSNREPLALARDMSEPTRLMELAGRVDTSNRYPAGVLVTVELGQRLQGVCSGAVIGRQLVLTAGHCVCRRRQDASEPGRAREVIDNSACAMRATVQTTLYEPTALSMDTGGPASRQYLNGEVRAHPELRVLLDERGEVTASHADLAVILLERPLGEQFRPLPLADTDVEHNEQLIITGSGHDELTRRYDNERRFSRNRVVDVLASGGGRLRIEQPGGHHYKGDSGGPCLREGPRGAVLVGISSRNLGEGEAITSTYEYRDWLLSEIQHAGQSKRPSRVQ